MTHLSRGVAVAVEKANVLLEKRAHRQAAKAAREVLARDTKGGELERAGDEQHH